MYRSRHRVVRSIRLGPQNLQSGAYGHNGSLQFLGDQIPTVSIPATREVARPPRASTAGRWGAGLSSFPLRLQPDLDQAADHSICSFDGGISLSRE
jgi:hypothetical protein